MNNENKLFLIEYTCLKRPESLETTENIKGHAQIR